MVVWGRADGLNPTDNLSPKDFTLLVPEDGDQRYGNSAAQISLNSKLGNFSGLWFPHAASYTLPLLPTRNVRYSIEPSRKPSWAPKWEGNTEGIDRSVSYFHGADPMPNINFKSLSSNGVEIAVRNHSSAILGADLSMTKWRTLWRAEAAYMKNDSRGAQDFEHKKSQFWLVAGGEWSLGESGTFNLQATVLKTFKYGNPNQVNDPFLREIAWRQAATSNQVAPTQAGFSWRLAGRWRNDALLAELSGVAVWPSRSGIWRTKLDYAVNDHWHIQTGTDYYYGTDHTFFGQLKNNQVIYIQARYGL